MRITRTDYTPIDLIAELIAPRTVTATDTRAFFRRERSSHDWAVPAWAGQIEVVLQSFKRYATEVAETQFVGDRGVDVRLSFETKAGVSRQVGFQIKSNQEATRDAIKGKVREPLIATLKRQAYDAEHHAKVDEWWIVSCFDQQTYRRLVSAINSELTGKRSSFKIRHVTPREAQAFLALEKEEIDAICTLLLCEDDEVLRLARRELLRLGSAAQEMVLQTLGPALEGERRVTMESLHGHVMTHDESDIVVRDVNDLESNGYLVSDGSEGFTIEPSVFVGLCALYFEARARHDHGPGSASRFVSLMTQRRPRKFAPK